LGLLVNVAAIVVVSLVTYALIGVKESALTSFRKDE